VDERVALHAHASQESCPYCHDKIAEEQETWVCDRCGTKLHAECFRENELRCTVLGCAGRAVVPAGSRVEPLVLGPEEESARAERRARRQPCPRCHEPMSFSEETWACDGCSNLHHAACFRANEFRCSVIGCRGRPRLPAGARADRRALRSLTKEEKRVARRARRARSNDDAHKQEVAAHRRDQQEKAARMAAEWIARIGVAASPPRTEPPHVAPAQEESWARGPVGLFLLLGSALAFLPVMLATGQPGLTLFGLAVTVAIWLLVLAAHVGGRK
jgi:hypothetical protein